MSYLGSESWQNGSHRRTGGLSLQLKQSYFSVVRILYLLPYFGELARVLWLLIKGVKVQSTGIRVN
jgi:hypothetical protein